MNSFTPPVLFTASVLSGGTKRVRIDFRYLYNMALWYTPSPSAFPISFIDSNIQVTDSYILDLTSCDDLVDGIEVPFNGRLTTGSLADFTIPLCGTGNYTINLSVV